MAEIDKNNDATRKDGAAPPKASLSESPEYGGARKTAPPKIPEPSERGKTEDAVDAAQVQPAYDPFLPEYGGSPKAAPMRKQFDGPAKVPEPEHPKAELPSGGPPPGPSEPETIDIPQPTRKTGLEKAADPSFLRKQAVRERGMARAARRRRRLGQPETFRFSGKDTSVASPPMPRAENGPPEATQNNREIMDMLNKIFDAVRDIRDNPTPARFS